MTNFPSGAEPQKSFGTFGAVFTLILLPPMCILSIPAVIFAVKSRRLYNSGFCERSVAFSKKAKRYTAGAWAVAFIIALALLALYSVSRLSLI